MNGIIGKFKGIFGPGLATHTVSVITVTSFYEQIDTVNDQ